jgi:hypothetical protein
VHRERRMPAYVNTQVYPLGGFHIPGVEETLDLGLPPELSLLRDRALALHQEKGPAPTPVPELILSDAQAWATHTEDEDWLVWRARRCVHAFVGALSRGTGDPAFFNDELTVRGLWDHGVRPTDAYSHMNSTCVEIKAAGRPNIWVTQPYFNLPLALLQIMEDVAQGRTPQPETCVHSLIAVRHLVCERHELLLLQFYEILQKHFRGLEALRQRILTALPKYGNDQVTDHSQPLPTAPCGGA